MQQKALEKMTGYIEIFLDYKAAFEQPKFRHDWQQVLNKIKLDYAGGEVYTAQKLTWKQVEPALPPVGKAGRVRFIDLCDGMMLEVMKDPKKLIKPDSEWMVPDGKKRKEWARRTSG